MFCSRITSPSRTFWNTILSGKLSIATGSAFCWNAQTTIREVHSSASRPYAAHPKTRCHVYRRTCAGGDRVCFCSLRVSLAAGYADQILRRFAGSACQWRRRRKDREGVLELYCQTSAVEIWLCSAASRRTAPGVLSFSERDRAGGKRRSRPPLLLAAATRDMECVERVEDSVRLEQYFVPAVAALGRRLVGTSDAQTDGRVGPPDGVAEALPRVHVRPNFWN